MQAIPIIAKLGTALGAGAETATVVGASTALSLGGTALGTYGAIQSARYNAQLASMNAKIEQDNAKRVRASGAVSARDADIAALEVLSQEQANMGARGFALNSPSYLRRVNRNRRLATQDRLRIVDDAEAQARSAENRALGLQAESRNASRGAFFSLLEGAVGVGDSLIGGARLANELTARRISSQNREIG